MAKTKKSSITVEGLTYDSADSIRERLKTFYDIDAPISGGYGSSMKDLIVIDETDPAKAAYWEGQLVYFLEDTDPDAKTVNTISTSVLNDGRKTIAKYTISITFKSRIEDKTFNWEKDYYFDISQSFSK